MVSKQAPKRTKHIPQRTCIGCQKVLPKKALIRVVRTESGIQVDPSGKAPGRGAYIHGVRSCWEKAVKGSVARALKTELSDTDRQALLEFAQTLPAKDPSEAERDSNDLPAQEGNR